MIKPHSRPPKRYDSELADELNRLTLLDNNCSEKRPGLHPPPKRYDSELAEGLHALSLADKKPVASEEKRPDLSPPRGRHELELAENLNRLSLNDSKCSEKRAHLPPGRSDLAENRNAQLTNKKPAEKKKLSTLSAPHQTNFAGGPNLRPVANAWPTPSGAAAARPNQVKTPIPMSVPRAGTTRPTPASPTVTGLPRHSNPISPPEATANPSVSGPAGPALDITSSRTGIISSPLCLAASSPRGTTVRCNATTKAGEQCLRQIKPPEMYYHLDPAPVLYCYQHKAAMIAQTGFYVRKGTPQEKFVEPSKYIRKYLQKDTRSALTLEMEQKPSDADEPGYIYAFEIRDPERPDVLQLKVGRTTSLVRRLDQWDKHCGSRVPMILRGWWPGTAEIHDRTGGSLLKGNINAGERGPFCHRVERLVHLELTDLSLHQPYLHPDWPNVSEPPLGPPKKTVAKKPCRGCGKIHKEIFTFRRPEGGRYKGEEWERIVKPTIEKWGKFAREYYSTDSLHGRPRDRA